jgi:RNase P protein component
MSERDRQIKQQNRLRAILERREREAIQSKKVVAPPTEAELELSRIKTAREIQRLLSEHQAQLDAVKDEQHRYKTLTSSMLFETNKNGSSKANPSTFYTKELPADDKVARANVHHTGSHYVMAGSKQFQRGVRVKGVVSRHSKQAAIRNGPVSQKKNAVGGVHNKKSTSMAVLM